jgi:hypothetical protein
MVARIFKFTSVFPSFLPGPSHAVARAGLGDRPRLETATVGAEAAGRGRRSRVRGSAARPSPGPSRVIMSHHDRRVWGRGSAIGIRVAVGAVGGCNLAPFGGGFGPASSRSSSSDCREPWRQRRRWWWRLNAPTQFELKSRVFTAPLVPFTSRIFL